MIARILILSLALCSLALHAASNIKTKTIFESNFGKPLKLVSYFDPATGYELKLNGKSIYKAGYIVGGGPDVGLTEK